MVTATPVTVPPLPVTRGHESVLVVEDDEVLRKMVAGMLAADGYRVMDRKKAGPLRGKGRVLPDKPIQLLIANLAGDGETLRSGEYARTVLAEVASVSHRRPREVMPCSEPSAATAALSRSRPSSRSPNQAWTDVRLAVVPAARCASGVTVRLSAVARHGRSRADSSRLRTPAARRSPA